MDAMNIKYWCYLFFCGFLTELITIALHNIDVQRITRPRLMGFLFLWFMASSAKFLPLHFGIAAALFFYGWAMFLLMESPAWFRQFPRGTCSVYPVFYESPEQANNKKIELFYNNISGRVCGVIICIPVSAHWQFKNSGCSLCCYYSNHAGNRGPCFW